MPRNLNNPLQEYWIAYEKDIRQPNSHTLFEISQEKFQPFRKANIDTKKELTIPESGPFLQAKTLEDQKVRLTL